MSKIAHRPRAAVFALTAAVGVAVAVPRADTFAQSTTPPPLPSAAGARRPLAPATLPPGPAIEPRALAPPGSENWQRACSFRHPICVYADPATPLGASRATLDALSAADRAWDVVTETLGLPPPPASAALPYRIYLTREEELGGGATRLDMRDLISGLDRASAFTVMGPPLPEGCALEENVARELLRATLFGIAPGMDEGSARATTTMLARLAVPCAASTVDGATTFQRHPERPIVNPWHDPATLATTRAGDEAMRGAWLFFEWLDASYGREPGGVVRALWARTRSVTPVGAPRWLDEPDTFEILRATFNQAKNGYEELLVSFAVDRAFFGTSRGEPAAQTLGDAARVDTWDIPWPQRRCGSAPPERTPASGPPARPSSVSSIRALRNRQRSTSRRGGSGECRCAGSRSSSTRAAA